MIMSLSKTKALAVILILFLGLQAARISCRDPQQRCSLDWFFVFLVHRPWRVLFTFFLAAKVQNSSLFWFPKDVIGLNRCIGTLSRRTVVENEEVSSHTLLRRVRIRNFSRKIFATSQLVIPRAIDRIYSIIAYCLGLGLGFQICTGAYRQPLVVKWYELKPNSSEGSPRVLCKFDFQGRQADHWPLISICIVRPAYSGHKAGHALREREPFSYLD